MLFNSKPLFTTLNRHISTQKYIHHTSSLLANYNKPKYLAVQIWHIDCL